MCMAVVFALPFLCVLCCWFSWMTTRFISFQAAFMLWEAHQYNGLIVWCCAARYLGVTCCRGCRQYILLFVYVVFCSAGPQVNERQKKMNFLVNVCSLLWNHTSSQCLLDIRKYTKCIVTSHILPVCEITYDIRVLRQYMLLVGREFVDCNMNNCCNWLSGYLRLMVYVVAHFWSCVCVHNSETQVECFSRFVKSMDDSVKQLFTTMERSAKKYEEC